jgi:protein phosphatase
VKLNPSGNIPCLRASHASASSKNNKLYIYGGAIPTGALAPDILYCLNLVNENNDCFWEEINVTGSTPGKRYGHSMAYLSPFIILFGGSSGETLLNDVWILNLESSVKEWLNYTAFSNIPSPRMYHSFATCVSCESINMIFLHGGRDEAYLSLNDTWALKKVDNTGIWEWSIISNSNFTPLKRHSVRKIILLIILNSTNLYFTITF